MLKLGNFVVDDSIAPVRARDVYAAKFDVSVEEATEMWEYGFESARDLCSIGWGEDGSLTLLEHLDTLVS